jgi:ribosome-dependent ATPase
MIDFFGRLSGQDRRERQRRIDDLFDGRGLLPFPVTLIFRESGGV